MKDLYAHLDMFKLTWWELNFEHIRLPRKHPMRHPMAITINSCTPKEHKLIKNWCDTHEIFKLYKTTYWNTMISFHHNSDEIYMHLACNERTVVGERDVIMDMMDWLHTLTVRDKVVLVSNIDHSQLRKILKGHDAAIYKDSLYNSIYDDNLTIVSLSDSMLAMELTLRSD